MVHGDKFDYSKTEYHGALNDITIICKTCRTEFQQKAFSHLQGYGCKKCATNKLEITKEEFLKRAKEKHGDGFDYSETEYINYITPTRIRCLTHGYITISPDNHLNSCGCKECGKEMKTNKLRGTIVDFVEKAKKIHGNKYDYSLVDYKNGKTGVSIICPKHGIFIQTPHDHLGGHGCRKCGRDEASKSHLKTISLRKEHFIKKAIQKHGNKYDYSLVEYKNTNTEVIIICPVHGLFKQTPYCHLRGANCQKCNETRMEEQCRLFLERNNIEYIYQKKFDWLNRQSIDFYLPKYDVGIECQGRQHYMPIDFSGYGDKWAEIEFEKEQKRDNKKKKLCEENNLELYYIKYDEEISEKCSEIMALCENKRKNSTIYRIK